MRAPTFFQRITPAGNIKTNSRDDFSYNHLLINPVIIFYLFLAAGFEYTKNPSPEQCIFHNMLYFTEKKKYYCSLYCT